MNNKELQLKIYNLYKQIKNSLDRVNEEKSLQPFNPAWEAWNDFPLLLKRFGLDYEKAVFEIFGVWNNEFKGTVNVNIDKATEYFLQILRRYKEEIRINNRPAEEIESLIEKTRLMSGRRVTEVYKTACLKCGILISEKENRCPKCGWSWLSD